MASIASLKSPFSLKGQTPVRLRRKLQRKLALRLVGICFFGCLTGYLFFDSVYWMAGIWTALITVGLFIHTIQFVDSSERKLTAFLQALRQNDFTVTFAESRQADDYDLHVAFNELNSIFRNLRSERESQHQLLQVVMEQASSPLICFEEHNGEVYLVNNAAKQLLQIPFLQKVDSIGRVDFELPKTLRDIRDGEKKTYKLTLSGKVIIVTINASHILFEGRNLKIVTLQDVTSELAAKEADTWHKLFRVLTHEISNSAIPLSTLSSYIYEMVIKSREDERELTEEQRQDIMTSLKTIDQRSRTLKEFVQNFRLVGQVPDPRFERASLADMVNDSLSLFSREFEKENIQVKVPTSTDLTVHADRNLTQQVFINLLKNAMEAMGNMKSEKVIDIRYAKEGSHYVNVMIGDTGKGIPAEDLDQIFIPFFSTKKGGSGIGLSISRQIMQKQGGDLSVVSMPGKGSVFTASFVV